MAKTTKKRKPRVTSTSTQSGGVAIEAKEVNVKGDVVGQDKIVVNQAGGKQPLQSTSTRNKSELHSAWANGLFYLFAFVIVIGIVAWLAGTLNPIVLGIVVVTGIVTVPLIGALQLFMDKRLKEKSFVALMRLVIRQLPIISNLAKPK